MNAVFKPLVILIFALSALAQPALVPTLIEYLDLTAAQITRLRQSAADYNRFYAEKAQRYQQVARELAEESTREVLDPLALGQRYIEHEAICRELRAAYQGNYERNLSILTAAQRTRLSALDVVVTNSRLVGSATEANLIEGMGSLGSGQFDFIGGGFGWTQIGNRSSGVCGVPTVAANPILLNRSKEVQ